MEPNTKSVKITVNDFMDAIKNMPFPKGIEPLFRPKYLTKEKFIELSNQLNEHLNKELNKLDDSLDLGI